MGSPWEGRIPIAMAFALALYPCPSCKDSFDSYFTFAIIRTTIIGYDYDLAIKGHPKLSMFFEERWQIGPHFKALVHLFIDLL